jgi:hypothetical protein
MSAIEGIRESPAVVLLRNEPLREMECEELPRRSKGSHRTWYNAARRRLATLPDWGSRDVKIGTVRAVVRQPGLDGEEFRRRA